MAHTSVDENARTAVSSVPPAALGTVLQTPKDSRRSSGRQVSKALMEPHVRPTAHTSPDGIAATLDNCSVALPGEDGTVTACQTAPFQCMTRLVRLPSDRACEPTAQTSLADLANTEVSVADGAAAGVDTATGVHWPPC